MAYSMARIRLAACAATCSMMIPHPYNCGKTGQQSQAISNLRSSPSTDNRLHPTWYITGPSDDYYRVHFAVNLTAQTPKPSPGTHPHDLFRGNRKKAWRRCSSPRDCAPSASRRLRLRQHRPRRHHQQLPRPHPQQPRHHRHHHRPAEANKSELLTTEETLGGPHPRRPGRRPNSAAGGGEGVETGWRG